MGERIVGNDVVDLGDPRVAGKLRNERFLERVLAPGEREALAAAGDPEARLWTCWAGKEAAYKIVSKLRAAPPIFVHRDYVVREDAVEHEGRRYPLSVAVLPGPVIHAVATSGLLPEEAVAELCPLTQSGTPWDAPLEVLTARLSPREADAVHSLPSAAVRIGARGALARVLGVREARVEIVCDPGTTGRRPPRVLLDGRRGPADVSLSHHGDWIGWAIALSGRGT